MTRLEVITLIKKMLDLNQREQAEETYIIANKTWPQWNLRAAFEDMKAKS